MNLKSLFYEIDIKPLDTISLQYYVNMLCQSYTYVPSFLEQMSRQRSILTVSASSLWDSKSKPLPLFFGQHCHDREKVRKIWNLSTMKYTCCKMYILNRIIRIKLSKRFYFPEPGEYTYIIMRRTMKIQRSHLHTDSLSLLLAQTLTMWTYPCTTMTSVVLTSFCLYFLRTEGRIDPV